MGPSMLTPSSNMWNRGDSRQSRRTPWASVPSVLQQTHLIVLSSCDPGVRCGHHPSTQVVVTDWLYRTQRHLLKASPYLALPRGSDLQRQIQAHVPAHYTPQMLGAVSLAPP